MSVRNKNKGSFSLGPDSAAKKHRSLGWRGYVAAGIVGIVGLNHLTNGGVVTAYSNKCEEIVGCRDRFPYRLGLEPRSTAEFPDRERPTQTVKNMARYIIDPTGVDFNPDTNMIGVRLLSMNYDDGRFRRVFGTQDANGQQLTTGNMPLTAFVEAVDKSAITGPGKSKVCARDLARVVMAAQQNAGRLQHGHLELSAEALKSADNVYLLPPYGTAKDDPTKPNVAVYIRVASPDNPNTLESFELICSTGGQNTPVTASPGS